MNSSLENRFQEGVELLVDEGWPIERILARDPETADALRPLLLTVARITAPVPEARDGARSRSRDTFLAAAGRMAAAPATPASAEAPAAGPAGGLGWQTAVRSALSSLSAPRLRPVGLAIGMAAGLAVVGAQAVRAAERALPGDPLYAVKESTRAVALLWLTTDEAARARKAVEIEADRRDDVVAALGTGRAADVRFSGRVDAYSDETCVISGITVQLPAAVAALYADAAGGEGIQVGEWIMVEGRMERGVLTAQSVDHVPPSFVIPTETPLPVGTPAPGITAPVAAPSSTASPPTPSAAPAGGPSAPGAAPAGGARPNVPRVGPGEPDDRDDDAAPGSDGSREGEDDGQDDKGGDRQRSDDDKGKDDGGMDDERERDGDDEGKGKGRGRDGDDRGGEGGDDGGDG